MARSQRRTTEDIDGGRPLPDEVLLEEAPSSQPEHGEPALADPGVRRLSARDWFAIVRRACKRMSADNMTMVAQALAYNSFLAIPSVLLVVIGLFTLLAGPSTITLVISHLGHVMPGQAKALLSQSLHRLDHQHQATAVMATVG